MIQNFFEVTPAEVGALGSEPAVAVLREMICAEVINLGLQITDADVPYAVTTSDGGVDAEVRGQPKNAGNGLIFAPLTCYQVKAGDFNVTAATPAKIEELLMTPAAIGERTKAKAKVEDWSHKVGGISPRVQACLDAGGTFVTMLFGNDGVDKDVDATEKAIQEFLGKIDAKYTGAKVKVWRQSRIATLLRSFPAVSLQIKNLAGFQLISHARWAERNEMQPQYEVGPEQAAVIASIHAALRDDSRGGIHIRMIGEPGIGKTRLTLEALRADDLAPLVLYADKASKVDGQVAAALYAAKHARIILVVDECGPDQRNELARSFGDIGPTLKIVSIYQDAVESDEADNYRLQMVPRLPDDEIEAILKTYGVDHGGTKGWAEICEGSPRVAHVIGANLRDHPGDPLKSDGVAEVWVRFIAGAQSRDSQEYRRRHLVLSCLALFKRFGWAAPVREGSKQVYDLLVSQLDKNISLADFNDVITQMANRKVLQGDNFLYITPKALHIKLWMDWWSAYGASINVNDLVLQLNPAMREWFGEMLEYAAAAPVSKKVVADLLGPEGLYKDSDWLKTKEGGRFFFSLSLADPHGAMRMLERTVGKMSHAELLKFNDGRRNVVWALDNLALYSELFRPAARLLLALALAENETWSNNASGEFTGLFSLGYGEIAPTSLSPDQRLPVLTDALGKGGEAAELAIKAFDTSFALQSISRWGGDQPFRLNERVKRWMPKTNGEWFAAYELYWKTLRGWLPKLSKSLRVKAANTMLSHMRELLRIEMLHDELMSTLEEFAAHPDLDSREIIEDISRILKYETEGLPETIVEKLKSIRDQLIGVTFASRLKRYAGMDLLEDRFDGENEVDLTAADIKDLAVEAVEKPQELERELKWLVTDEAKNGYRFGFVLSALDTKCELWPMLYGAWKEAGKSASDYFLGGYLSAVFARDQTKWEEIIREIARLPENAQYIPGLVWRSGMNDSVALLLLEIAKKGGFTPRYFGIFSAGKTTDPISDPVFNQWLEYLLSVGSFESIGTAMNLASMSMMSTRKLGPEMIEKIISHPGLFVKEGKRNDVMLTHYWLRLSKKLISQKPDAEIKVLKLLIQNIGNRGAITAHLGPDGDRYLDQLVAKHPREAWQIISPLINPPMDTRGFVITRWLRGDTGFSGRDPGPMRHIPREVIWDWIKSDPDRRAPYVASMAPKDFEPASWKDSIVRALLVEFGEHKSLQDAVYANFFTGGFSGPASAHYEIEKSNLLQIKSQEVDPNALRWLDDAIKATEAHREQAKIEEEARGY
jgi:hypothetical protein